MQKLICLFTILFICNSAFGNISLTPFYLGFDAGLKNRIDSIRFTNTTKDERTYNIKLVNFRQGSDGSYKTIETPVSGNPFANKYLEYSPHTVTLKPMDTQVVRVQRRGMASAPAGEYVSHLLVQEIPKKQPNKKQEKTDNLVINLETIYGVSIPVMITKGELSATARIKDIKIQSVENQYFANVTVERFGTRSFYGTVIVKDDEKEIGKISKFRIFMTTPNRILKVPLNKKPKNTVSVTLIDEHKNETLETKSI